MCEDESGNLVVIELKRDHGYDDPYDQIIQYIEWLKQNMCKSGKTVSGIICLNSPTKNLISKVRSDKRVQLYEYQVSYHDGARPLCYPWQGKIISRTDNARDVPDDEGNPVHVYAQSCHQLYSILKEEVKQLL